MYIKINCLMFVPQTEERKNQAEALLSLEKLKVEQRKFLEEFVTENKFTQQWINVDIKGKI